MLCFYQKFLWIFFWNKNTSLVILTVKTFKEGLFFHSSSVLSVQLSVH